MITHLVFDGVADGPLGVALDLVATAARLSRGGGGRGALRQRVLSVDGRDVRSGAGRAVAVDGAFARRRWGAEDVVLLPGLGAATEAEVDALLARPDVSHGGQLLAAAAARGALVGASCSATFVVAASGLLDGRAATTTWWLQTVFAARFPRVRLRAKDMVVDAGGVVTAGAALAHADLVLAVLARVAGPSAAQAVARYLLLDERVSQARYMVLDHVRSADPVVRTLEDFVTGNLGRQVSLDEMARATATSPRTLARRVHGAVGLSPQRFAQRLRVARAVYLLETTHDAVEEVAARVGYADAAAFRRVFRREIGETPGRRRHGGGLRPDRRRT